MPRFVILRHELPAESGRPSHWDFMLEQRDATGEISLRTWAIERSPDSVPPQPASLLPDHRAAYLDYEGPISGGRGEVTRWDEGTFEAVPQSSVGEVGGDFVEIVLVGLRLRGTVSFRRQVDGANDPSDFEYRYVAAATLAD